VNVIWGLARAFKSNRHHYIVLWCCGDVRPGPRIACDECIDTVNASTRCAIAATHGRNFLVPSGLVPSCFVPSHLLYAWLLYACFLFRLNPSTRSQPPPCNDASLCRSLRCCHRGSRAATVVVVSRRGSCELYIDRDIVAARGLSERREQAGMPSSAVPPREAGGQHFPLGEVLASQLAVRVQHHHLLRVGRSEPELPQQHHSQHVRVQLCFGNMELPPGRLPSAPGPPLLGVLVSMPASIQSLR
jgi:hypothetical protein